MWLRSAGAGAGALNLAFPQVLLNPFAAPFRGGTCKWIFVRWQVPAWIVGVVICLLFTRLILTAAARKVGLYDKDVLPSARRQLLLLFPLNMLLCVLPFACTGRRSCWDARYCLHSGSYPYLCRALFSAGGVDCARFGQDGDTPCPDDGMFQAVANVHRRAIGRAAVSVDSVAAHGGRAHPRPLPVGHARYGGSPVLELPALDAGLLHGRVDAVLGDWSVSAR
jgi:hypothetical protein